MNSEINIYIPRVFLESYTGEEKQLLNELFDIYSNRHSDRKATGSLTGKVHALQYVKEQTEEICLNAVSHDGLTLKYVKEYVNWKMLIIIYQKNMNCYVKKNVLIRY